jgi:RHS repeat-associated protein
MTDENNKVTSYSYDKSNWLTQVVYPNADVVTYVYNDAGDRISEQTNENPAVTYSYDAAGRMIAKGDEAYNYDADGNMLSDSEASYIWNSDNRLLRVEKTIDDCKHDKNRKGHGYGHLKHSKESVAYEEYTYLPQDWRRITRKTGKIQSDSKKKFGYNPKSEELTYVSIYDGADESHEYLVTEPKFKFRGRCNPAKPQLKIFREFIGGPGSDDIAYTRYNHLSLAMLKDGLGSTIALTSKDGKAIARIGYDAWGEFRWNDKDCKKSPCKENEFESYLNRFGTTWGFGHANHNGWAFGKSFAKKLTPYLYTGRRYSEITNQYFNRNRYYSPALGRFISKDPIGFNGGMNLYRYADNNPVLFTDPTGQFPITIITLMKLKALVIGIDVFFWFQNVDYHCDKLCPGNGRVWPLPATFQVTGNQYRLFQYKPQENENALVDNYVKSDWRSFEWGDCFYRFLFVGDPEPPFIQNQ